MRKSASNFDNLIICSNNLDNSVNVNGSVQNLGVARSSNVVNDGQLITTVLSLDPTSQEFIPAVNSLPSVDSPSTHTDNSVKSA